MKEETPKLVNSIRESLTYQVVFSRGRGASHLKKKLPTKKYHLNRNAISYRRISKKKCLASISV